MPKGLSKAVHRRRTAIAMTKRTTGQTMIYKTLHYKLNIKH